MDSVSPSGTERPSTAHRVLTVIGAVLCVILLPILIMNVTLIIRSYANPDEVPGVGGNFPLIILTDSMYPDIKSGDLVVCRTVDTSALRVGDVIAFHDPSATGDGVSITVHRIVAVGETEEGELAFTTRGDANNTDDPEPVPASSVLGIYRLQLNGMGSVAMFMQTTQGLILCVGVPVLLLVGYDVLRTRLYAKRNAGDTAALMAELEALRAAQREREAQDGARNA